MTHPLTETLDLVRKSHDGDNQALNRLFERYYARVLKVVRLRLGQKLRRRVDSMDILQDTFATAVRKFDKFEMRNDASFINWLSKLAENTIHDNAERHSAKMRDPDREVGLQVKQDGQTTELSIDAGFAVPLDQMVRNEEQDILDECIEALPERYRECIVLRNYVGMSFREIAEETGRPTEGAARMMHAKAMAELVEAVEAKRGG